jgi:hypothetical protein
MAGALLKSWNAPATVTAVSIDAAGARTTNAENCSVSDLRTGSSVTWTQLDNALPMPMDLKDPVSALAIRSSDVVDSLNRQILSVTGLRGKDFALLLDGEEIGIFDAEALVRGVNLATHATPMMRQAAAVHALTLKHNNIHFTRWRQIQLPLENESLVQTPLVLGALDSLEAELVQRQRELAQPKPHRFEIRAAKPGP